MIFENIIFKCLNVNKSGGYAAIYKQSKLVINDNTSYPIQYIHQQNH